MKQRSAYLDYSKSSLIVIILTLFMASFFYYPKWTKTKTEATISWDVSGYYLYLPASFIYKDLKTLSFYPGILNKYEPTPDFQQAYKIENGNMVCKYSMGMAIQYIPAFIAGHVIAKMTNHPTDGYSMPYQLALHIYSFLIAVAGLLLWFLFLRRYFSNAVVAITLVSICLGSNYLTYTGITNAMSHNYLLTAYAALLLITDNFYKKPKWSYAVGIGLICGIMALTRPTELIATFIPLCYGLSKNNWRDHLNFLYKHIYKIITAVLICGSIGALQLAYWKYVSGSWIQYSYEDQGFSFLSPHILEGLFHINNGWLTYSPMMLFSIVGLYHLFKSEFKFRQSLAFYILLFIYVAFSWDIWWYGGSVGQRTMVQLCPLLSIPFACFTTALNKRSKAKVVMIVIASLLIYYNLWITHQAHLGEFYLTEKMSKKFLVHTIGKNKVSKTSFNLLDKAYYYDGFRKNINTLYTFNSKIDSSQESIVLNTDTSYSRAITINIESNDFDWIRISGTALQTMEYNYWNHTQLIVELYHSDELVKKKFIRINKFFDKDGEKSFYMDFLKPKNEIDKLMITFHLPGGDKKMEIKKIKVETFNS